MPRSFQERLDVFCSDFAAVGNAVPRGELPSLDMVRAVLTSAPDEEGEEFRFRCDAVVHAYAYVVEHWAAFQNIGFIRHTDDGRWIPEGSLLYALCLYLGSDEEFFWRPPELDVVINAALHGPV